MIEVTVVPRSKKFQVTVKEGRVRIYLKSPAQKNKANIELVRELSRLLGTEVRIISGLSSRKKKLDLGMSEKEFFNKIINS